MYHHLTLSDSAHELSSVQSHLKLSALVFHIPAPCMHSSVLRRTMAVPTLHTTLLGLPVPVYALSSVPPVALAAALACRPFREWAASLDSRFTFVSLTIQSVDFFGPRVGFVKLIAEASWCGTRVPGVIFLRGGAVSVLPLLSCGGERWVVCARQPRLAVGGDFLELPAGMIDDAGSFVGVAAKEMEEETGIVIDPHQLIDLTSLALNTVNDNDQSPPQTPGNPRRGLYPSVGACDEFLRLFFFQKTVAADELQALHGKLTGSKDENEQITLQLVRYEDLWRATVDAKTLASVFLLEKLVQQGKIILL